ncbi:MAG: preprotein translocase subunit YajC [Microbacteriaceae bacterium]|nr:preprotein translocase subunit YajC [Microbacteriaceae bacterium]
MDPTLILLVVALGAFIVFQVFQGKKRKRETEERQTKFVPGIEIMTNYGLYGTILTMDEETNVVEIESAPGTVLRIHRQTILKVADYAVVAEPEEATDILENDDPAAIDEPAADGTRAGAPDGTRAVAADGTRAGAPEFGERVEPEVTSAEQPKKSDD